MKRPLLLLLLMTCAWLPACALFQRPPRPVYAPPEEAARFVWPVAIPEEGHQFLTGPMVMAIQLAMEDFLPWDIKPHKGATPSEICLYKRDSYDVLVSPGTEGLVYVAITLRQAACHEKGEILLDMGALYAIDVKNWRLLAVER
jgi:hypothetical protein